MLQVDMPHKSKPPREPRRFYDQEKLEAQVRALLPEGTVLPSMPIPAAWHLPVIAWSITAPDFKVREPAGMDGDFTPSEFDEIFGKHGPPAPFDWRDQLRGEVWRAVEAASKWARTYRRSCRKFRATSATPISECGVRVRTNP